MTSDTGCHGRKDDRSCFLCDVLAEAEERKEHVGKSCSSILIDEVNHVIAVRMKRPMKVAV